MDFHVHSASDELFYCVEGEFDVDFDDEITHLKEGDFIVIPKGTRYRSICKKLVKCLLIEINGTLNKNKTSGMFSE